MPISEGMSLVGGAVLGGPFTDLYERMITKAKQVRDFKLLSEDFASTMERLITVFEMIDSMQQGSKGELEVLFKTMQRAEEVVRECSTVNWYSVSRKTSLSKEILDIQQKVLRFCQIDLPLIQLRNQLLKDMPSRENVATETSVKDLFLVPQPQEVTVNWLDRPLKELKKMLLEDGVATAVVSAPSACGKTTLVTKLCHDADVKGKFKHIVFITVSKAPNICLIVERLLEHSGYDASDFASNSDARLCIQLLLMQLSQSGSVLLVLEDVWPEEESFLEMFMLPDYSILVTSRFEFPNFGPAFHLEPLVDEDVKSLFIEFAADQNQSLPQESLNMVEYPPLRAESKCASFRAPLDEDEQFSKAVVESLKEKGKGKQFGNEQVTEDEQFSVEDEQLAAALEESLMEKGQGKQYGNEQVKEDEQFAVEDEQLAAALEESLMEKGKGKQYGNEQVTEDEQFAVEDEQLAAALEESLMEKGKGKQYGNEQVKEDEQFAVEDEQLAAALEESLMEKGKGKKFGNEQVTEDEQFAMVEDEMLAMAVKESLKEKGKGKQFENEQVKEDEQFAVALQESLKTVQSPPLRAESKCVSRRTPLDEDEQLAKAVEESLKEKGKGEQFGNEQVKEDEGLAVALQESLNTVKSPPRPAENEYISTRAAWDEDEQLAKALEESFMERGKGNRC